MAQEGQATHCASTVAFGCYCWEACAQREGIREEGGIAVASRLMALSLPRWGVDAYWDFSSYHWISACRETLEQTCRVSECMLAKAPAAGMSDGHEFVETLRSSVRRGRIKLFAQRLGQFLRRPPSGWDGF